jgi:hypothetical protein
MCLFHLSGRISTHYLHTGSCTRSFLHESTRLLDSPWTMRSNKISSRLLHGKYNCGLSTLIASSRIQLQLFHDQPHRYMYHETNLQSPWLRYAIFFPGHFRLAAVSHRSSPVNSNRDDYENS